MVQDLRRVGLKKAGIILIGPMDLIPDNKLQDMGDAAIGTVVMGHYAVDLESPANKEFKEEWHKPMAPTNIRTSCRRRVGTRCTPSSTPSRS